MNITQYTVQEDATPRDPSQFSGGYGQLTYTRLENNKKTDYGTMGTIVEDTDGQPYVEW